MKKTKKENIVILGAGLAGLAAAYELVRAHKKVILLEKEDAIGGLARTFDIKGFRFDTGPHRWYTKSNMVNDWMIDLLKDELIQVPRLTRIYFDRHFFYYPIKLKNALFGIGLGRALMAVVDYIIARLRARLTRPKLLTMEDGYINQFGKTLYETFFKRYSEKLWGQDCRNISLDWVGQRTRGLNILTIIKDVFFKTKGVVSLVDEFSYPQKGVGRIAEKMAEFITSHGGTIRLNTTVTGLKHQQNRITSVMAKEKGKMREYKGDYVISSIPLDEMIYSLSPGADKAIVQTAKKLTYRDELQVALFIQKTHITPDTWIYVHPKEIPFMRVMEMDNWSSVLSPKGTTTMVFEIACNVGDDWWKKKDAEIIDIISDSFIKEFQLVTKKDMLGGYVHRMEKEYPVYHITYKEDVSELKSYVSRFYNLQLIGRNGTFRYNNMDHSIEMGLYAAWNIIANKTKYDIDSVNIEREYLEEKKIENIEDEIVEEDSPVTS